MRTAFIRTLTELAEADSRINLVVGDLGFGVVVDFAERFPDQFLNAGVAEQSMTGIASGMAMCGKIVFTYSIGNFPTLRCLEQIRNDTCYHNADVKIVSVGGGVAYGAVGATHHATEDIAVLRALPNMTVVAPGDPIEAAHATAAVAAHPGPCYLRLGRAGEQVCHQATIDFKLGQAIKLRDGNDVALIVSGGMLCSAKETAARLATKGIQTRLLSMHTIKPLDTDAVLAAARETNAIVTLEEHSVIGGLGSAVVEALADSGMFNIPVKRIGLPSKFISEVGDQQYLLSINGLSVEGISQTIEQFLTHAEN